MEIDWKIAVPLIVGLITLLVTIYFKRHEITSIKHKKISDRLSSSIQYFEKYYEAGQTNQLVLDRAAQDLAKCVFVNHALANKLIDLHQNFLIDFDEMIFIFEDGHYYLEFKKCKEIDVKKDIYIKPFWILGLGFRKGLFVLGYFIFAFIGIMLLFTILNKGLGTSPLAWILSVVSIIFSTFFIISALFFLTLESRLAQASKFIVRLVDADEKYKKIEMPKRIILLSKNEKPS